MSLKYDKVKSNKMRCAHRGRGLFQPQAPTHIHTVPLNLEVCIHLSRNLELNLCVFVYFPYQLKISTWSQPVWMRNESFSSPCFMSWAGAERNLHFVRKYFLMQPFSHSEHEEKNILNFFEVAAYKFHFFLSSFY